MEGNEQDYLELYSKLLELQLKTALKTNFSGCLERHRDYTGNDTLPEKFELCVKDIANAFLLMDWGDGWKSRIDLY